MSWKVLQDVTRCYICQNVKMIGVNWVFDLSVTEHSSLAWQTLVASGTLVQGQQ